MLIVSVNGGTVLRSCRVQSRAFDKPGHYRLVRGVQYLCQSEAKSFVAVLGAHGGSSGHLLVGPLIM